MHGTGRGSERRRYSVPPPPALWIWKQTGTGLGGCLCLCMCCIWKHKCLKIINSSTNVCFSYGGYTELTEISYSANKRWGIWLRCWETKFITFLNPVVRLEDTDKRDDDCHGICLCLRCSLLFHTTATAGWKAVLMVLIFDISSHFHWIYCGKAFMHMYAHVCTHGTDRTTHTILLQKHTDNLYLCVQTVFFPP